MTVRTAPAHGGEQVSPPRGRRRTLAQQEDREGRLLVAPTLLVVTGVVLLPFAASVALAFLDVRLIDIPRLSLTNLEVTLENFADALDSRGFWSAARTTVVYAAACTIGSIGAGLLVALALRRPFRGRGLVRGLILIPYVLPVVAAATVWKTLLNAQYGAVNAFGQRFLGWDAPISFLTTGHYEVFGVGVPLALLVVVAFEVWKTFPLAFLFITARLQAVPGDLEEAALIDGASPLQQFRYVVLPQLTGVLLLLGVLRFIWSFQSFADIYLLTGGAGDTEVLAVRLYDQLVRRADVGAASALGLLMMLVLGVLLVVYVRLSRKEVDQ